MTFRAHQYVLYNGSKCAALHNAVLLKHLGIRYPGRPALAQGRHSILERIPNLFDHGRAVSAHVLAQLASSIPIASIRMRVFLSVMGKCVTFKKHVSALLKSINFVNIVREAFTSSCVLCPLPAFASVDVSVFTTGNGLAPRANIPGIFVHSHPTHFNRNEP